MRKYIHNHFPRNGKSGKGKQQPQQESKNHTPEHTLTIHTVYSDPNPTLHVIALHGHTGHHTRSFTHNTTQIFWLKDLLPLTFHSSSPPINIRIISLSYSAKDENVLGAKRIASFFLTELVGMGVGSKGMRIVWVAHSFGGPLLKGMLGVEGEEGEIMRLETSACLMFGVARGSGVWDSFGGASEKGMSDEMKKLKDEAMWLKESNEMFEKERKKRGWDITYVLESSGDVVASVEGKDEREGGVRVVRSSKTHGQMVKFEGEGDKDWLAIKRVILDMMPQLSSDQTPEVAS